MARFGFHRFRYHFIKLKRLNQIRREKRKRYKREIRETHDNDPGAQHDALRRFWIESQQAFHIPHPTLTPYAILGQR